MLLLAVDTSGKNGSLALARVTASGSALKIVEEVALAGGTFSAQLVPQTAALLEKHGYGKGDLAGFAVVSGPGSFTGLRVGLAAIKALAEILHKPIAAVSLLEAIAAEVVVLAAGNRAANLKSRCMVVMDARPNEIFAGEYEIGGATPALLRESLLTVEELVCSAEELGRS